MRFELTDYEWDVIRPMLPNKPRAGQRAGRRTTTKRKGLRLANFSCLFFQSRVMRCL